MQFEKKFKDLVCERWRMIFGTGEEYIISDLGRLARWDGEAYTLWSPIVNSHGESGLNLEILVDSSYIQKGSWKFYPMQRLMAIIWLSEGDREFLVTKRDKNFSNWKLDNLKLNYKPKKELKFMGEWGTFWRSQSKSEKGLDIHVDVV